MRRGWDGGDGSAVDDEGGSAVAGGSGVCWEALRLGGGDMLVVEVDDNVRVFSAADSETRSEAWNAARFPVVAAIDLRAEGSGLEDTMWSVTSDCVVGVRCGAEESHWPATSFLPIREVVMMLAVELDASSKIESEAVFGFEVFFLVFVGLFV